MLPHMCNACGHDTEALCWSSLDVTLPEILPSLQAALESSKWRGFTGNMQIAAFLSSLLLSSYFAGTASSLDSKCFQETCELSARSLLQQSVELKGVVEPHATKR